ncbi:hypothetical protein CK203_031745 [Vitis vinifera]|uniref:Uncharacterized protein n=1 Tax=Vitis vinifera TaxID=29760 RepID=A0A438I3F3_VITVI|nr:hypothetical protein CK203_031745 [Vitis vinifera]
MANKTIGGCVRTPCPDVFCRLQHQGLLDVSVRGPSSKLKASQEPESIYPGTTGAIPGACTQDLMSHARLCLELPVRKAQTLLTFQQKDNVIKNPSCQIRCARLGPQEPGRSRPPMATTWAPRPDPMATPMVQNVHPHRDPVVTPVMRNVHSHPAERPAGETSQTSHPWLHQQKAG